MFKSLPIISIFFLLLALAGPKSYAEVDNNHAINPADFSVFIDQTTQQATGIKTLELRNSQFSPEIETFAIHVDLSPLINVRKDYLLAKVQQETAYIKMQQSQRNVQRLQSLQRDQAVSTLKLRDQQVQLKIDQALFNTAEQQANTIQLFAQAKWGEILSSWFLNDAPPSDNMLSTLKRSLYLIYLPPQISVPGKTIFIQPFGLREKAQSASFIADAPIFENTQQQQQAGTPFFYLSDQVVQHYHQRVTAWLPINEEKLTGIIIPASALVWHLGQAFVYLQVDDEQFKRVKITQKKLVHSDAYFIQNELQHGDKLVSIGAQMLLSEEFRNQIPAEDDDD
ncbi:hypothetical protein AU255_09920 [Methyloprofundus sedimenti]|uniref:RND efflux pump membrane fusion protein barrel-sandwich domain-containing protein n=1 Tax=Methyloprofundus sedimenti TaxID=1420851 RepID=A0A1V8M946_9GAMM|nr:hypothetical protein [Methyloprofundus sedimenti]OQK18134.1 hypothetical protein AU255_09920 [Methyloprofundus sedimenti]